MVHTLGGIVAGKSGEGRQLVPAREKPISIRSTSNSHPNILDNLLELVGDLGPAHSGGTSGHEHGTRGAHPDS